MQSSSVDLMEKEKARRLKRQSLASVIALIFSFVILGASFFYSQSYIARLGKRVIPLLDAALEAAHDEQFERVHSLCIEIDALLDEAEPVLKVLASHRDLMEMLRCSHDLVNLGTEADQEAYIQAISGIRSYLELLYDSNRVSIEGIL